MTEKRIGDFLFEPKNIPQRELSEFRGMDPAVLDKILSFQAQTATIRSIVQTDSFEVEDNTSLSVEEKRTAAEVKTVRQLNFAINAKQGDYKEKK